ncbi:MAG: glycosyltransferase [Coriobacteriia bacterium]|nr:glycosyltransferase [Coriobacteriia bacterium]
MRIGLFCDTYMPYVSGVTNHIRLYKHYYEQQGHEVFLFTFGNHDYADDEPHVIRTRGFEWRETGWNLSPQFGTETKALIPTLDIAHTHHPFQSGYLLLPYTQRYDIPLVFTNHTRYDLYSDAYVSYVPPTLRYGVLTKTLSHFLNRCNTVITPSRSIAQWLANFVQYWYATVVPNGIDVDMFATPLTHLKRSDLGLHDDATVFCYAGRIATEKNVLYLLDEFKQVADKFERAQLLMVGGGSEYEKAQEHIRAHGLGDKVICTDMQPYEMLPAYESLADIFVTGSVSEVHPLVVLEAMAASLPVVAIDSPGIRETVCHDYNGLLAEQIAPGALSSNMLRLASDRALSQKLRRGTQETVVQYTLPHTAGKVLAEYERLVGHTTRALV